MKLQVTNINTGTCNSLTQSFHIICLIHPFFGRPSHRRTGRGGRGGSCPPIRAVCRHEFGQRVDIIRAKHNTCLKNTNLGYVTAFNGKKYEFRVCYCSYRKKFCHPAEYGSRKISATTPPPPLNMDPGKFLLLPPPH